MKHLQKNMTLAAFDKGYWYLAELKQFAVALGVKPVTGLRKDQLEFMIRGYLKTGRLPKHPGTAQIKSKNPLKDSEGGLSLKQRVISYTNDKTTKDFLIQEAAKAKPGFREKPGSRYRLNRWREQELAAGKRLTYGQLVQKLIEFSENKEPFAKIPQGRYINFIADYLKDRPGTPRRQAIADWHRVKKLDIPKTYAAWQKYNRKR